MANKRFSQFSDRQLGPDEPRPQVGLGSTPQPKLPGESTAAWPSAPGPKGRPWNAVGYPEVKAWAKKDLADDKAKLGSGARFKALKEKLEKRGDVRDPGAVAATIGRKKYGAKRFAKLSAKGR